MTSSTRLEALADRIAGLSRPLLLALDVDGTLAPIVDDPDAARVPSETRRVVRELARTRGLRVALITGRDARSLRSVVQVPGVWRAVEHGARVLAPGERATKRKLDPEAARQLAGFRSWAEEELAPRGAVLEDKPSSVAVHVRSLAATDPRTANDLLRRARERAHAEGLHPRDGRAVCEAEVAPGDKGEALDEVIRASRARGVVYAGDDVTDRPAIRRASERGGIGLFVRSSERARAPKAATASLSGPDDVAELLRAVARRFKTPATRPPARSRSTRAGRARRSPKR